MGTPKQKEEISVFIEDGVELPGGGDVLYDTSTPSLSWILILARHQDQDPWQRMCGYIDHHPVTHHIFDESRIFFFLFDASDLCFVKGT